MNTNETIAVFPIAEHRAIDDADEEGIDAQMSDDEILMAFLSDGCDLDGTPLLMMDEPGGSNRPGHKAPTLH